MTVDPVFGSRWPASSNEIAPDDDGAAKEIVYGEMELEAGKSVALSKDTIDTG